MRSQNKATFSFLLAITMCTLVLSSSAHVSHAATSYVLSPTDPTVGAVCASLGGAWKSSSICTLGSNLNLDSGDSILVDPGAVLAIPRGVTVANNGSIDDYGTIAVNAGGLVTNSGTITAFIANGTITNDGSITNYPGGSIGIEHPGHTSVHVGAFNFTNSGTLDNRGTFVNFGNFTNSAAASITNSGSFSFASATINIGNFSAPLATNAGTFTNTAGGNVTVDGATFNNTGTLTNPGRSQRRRTSSA